MGDTCACEFSVQWWRKPQSALGWENSSQLRRVRSEKRLKTEMEGL